MTKIPNIAEILASRFNQDKPTEALTTAPCVTILEIEHTEQSSGRHSRRLAELRKRAVLQERIIHRILDSSIEKSDQPKKPHLKIVK
jgi:hypothetical protein